MFELALTMFAVLCVYEFCRYLVFLLAKLYLRRQQEKRIAEMDAGIANLISTLREPSDPTLPRA